MGFKLKDTSHEWFSVSRHASALGSRKRATRLTLLLISLARFTPMAPNIVILGGRIIGSSVAYHLSLAGAACTALVERSHPGPVGASGRAAGFLAKSWGDGSLTERLHRESFKMHEELANELGLSSYRRIVAYGVGTDRAAGDDRQDGAASVDHGGPSWLDGAEVQSTALLDSEAAQVDPAELSRALLDAALSRGASLLVGEVSGIETVTTEDEDEPTKQSRRATGVRLSDGTVLAADIVCVALGPWSCAVEDWLGVPLPLEGIRSSSALWRGDGAALGAPASLFCAEDARGCHLEVHPRANGDLYVCGCGGSSVVPGAALRAGEVPPEAAAVADAARIAAATKSLRGLSRSLGRRPPDTTQACIRPCTPDGKPALGRLHGVRGVYVAAGHNAWGITWAPVTGRAMAELILQGEARVVNLKPFSPRRFDTTVQRELMRERGRRRRGEPIGEQW